MQQHIPSGVTSNLNVVIQAPRRDKLIAAPLQAGPSSLPQLLLRYPTVRILQQDGCEIVDRRVETST